MTTTTVVPISPEGDAQVTDFLAGRRRSLRRQMWIFIVQWPLVVVNIAMLIYIRVPWHGGMWIATGMFALPFVMVAVLSWQHRRCQPDRRPTTYTVVEGPLSLRPSRWSSRCRVVRIGEVRLMVPNPRVAHLKAGQSHHMAYLPTHKHMLDIRPSTSSPTPPEAIDGSG